MEATSNSGIKTQTQMKVDDDETRVQHVIHKKGRYDQYMEYRHLTGGKIESSWGSGDASVSIGSEFIFVSKFAMLRDNDYDIYGASRFIKFDGDAVEPELMENGDKYKTRSYGGTMKFKVWYVTKPDGTNWTSQTDMNNGNIEDMNLYENIEDIPDGYTCIGMFLESTEGYLAVATGDNNSIDVKFKIKNTANIGQTYGFTCRTKLWKDELDRSIYTITNKDVTYPELEWDSGNRPYIKTEYNKNGVMVAGTHNGAPSYGNTVLVIGAVLNITSKSIDESGNTKVNYDLGKNEYDVTYQLQPSLVNANLKTSITGVNLKIEETLPVGMTYVPGSCEYDEPEITKNSDGTTLLVWYKYNCTVGEKIEPIVYKAHISEETANGVQYQTKTVVEEIIGEGEVYKVGNSRIADRTYTTSINVINLSNYSVYKTTTTPMIELNGQIHYKVTFLNKTEDTVNDFQMLDILPYSGDSRGSSFAGTYTVEKIDIKQTKSDETISNDNLKLYVTDSESVRTGVTVKDENLGTSSIWTQATSGQVINQTNTAYAITGTMTKNQIVVTYYYQLKNYPYTVNYLEKDTNKVLHEPKTQDGTTFESVVNSDDEVIDIYGYNYDSVDKDTLTISTGENVINIYYTKKDTKVTVHYYEEGTTNKVSEDVEIPGKVFDDYTTTSADDIPSKYELVAEPENKNGTMTEDEITVIYYYRKKVTQVIVHYYEENTTKRLSEDVTINGRVDDKYTTVSADDIPIKYELVAEPVNKSGNMTEETIEVIYYYKVKDAIVNVRYLEKGIDKVLADPDKLDGKVDDLYETSAKNIDGYQLVEHTGNERGKFEVEPLTITYYYLYKAKATVQYIDKTTGQILEQSTTEGLEGDDFVTESKDFENYVLVEEPVEKTVKMTKEEQTLKYYYIHISGGVIEKHIDVISGQILANAVHNGNEGDAYDISSRTFDGYDLVEDRLPANSKGTMTADPIYVIYYYKRPAKVIVNYYDIDTKEKLADEVEITGHQNDEYTTEQKDIKYYEIKEIPANKDGKMTVTVTKDENGKEIVEDTTYVNYYYRKLIFNLRVDKTIASVIVNGQETPINGNLGKVEVHRKELSTANVKVVYKIKVTNDSELTGKANVVENIPSGMTMKLDNNPGWTIKETTASLETDEIKPGESREYQVVLGWQNGDSNVGTKENIASIITENEAGFEEKDKSDNESKADLIVAVGTGEIPYVAIAGSILLIMIAMTAGVYVIKKRR